MTEDRKTEKLWPYVHGECSPEDRAELDAALQTDADLLAASAKVEALDRTLRKVVPLIDLNEAELADEILAALDADMASRETVREEPVVRRPLVFNPFIRVGLAMAAGLAIMLGVTQLCGTGALVWEDVTVASAAYRGADGGIEEVGMTQPEAQSLVMDFRKAVDTRYAMLRPEAKRREWRLQVNVVALHDGAFTLEVFGHLRRKPEVSYEWTRSFIGADEFVGETQTYAQQVAEGLFSALN